MSHGPLSLLRLTLLTLGCLGAAELRPLAQAVTGPATPIPRGRGVHGIPPSPRLFVVDDTPGCGFSTTIQPAIDAAGDGDIILVKKGFYQGFVIDGKSAHVFGEAGPNGTDVQLDAGAVEVKNLRADQPVVLRGLFSFAPQIPASFHDNAGPLWVERCAFSLVAEGGTVGLFSTTARACHITGGANVFAYRSTFAGTPGPNGYANCGGGCPSDSYYPDCYYQVATVGGAGVSVSTAGRAFLFGGALQGGAGGNGADAGICCLSGCGVYCARGGDALFLNPGTEAVLMDATLVPGKGGSVSWGSCSDGQPIAGSGTSTTLSGKVGGYSISSPLAAGSSALLTFTGPPGWNVFLTYSTDFIPAFVPERNGYSVVSPASPTIFIGALPLSGTLQVSMPFGLSLFEKAAVFYSQAKLYDPATGTPYLAEPSALLVMRSPCP